MPRTIVQRRIANGQAGTVEITRGEWGACPHCGAHIYEPRRPLPHIPAGWVRRGSRFVLLDCTGAVVKAFPPTPAEVR